MADKNFKGAGKALDAFDIPELAYRIDVTQDHLQAFLNVESRSQGFDRSGRPIILNEPHVFYRNLSGVKRTRAVTAGLAYPKWGTEPYLKTSQERYEWLAKAMKIDREAALKSCSWGSTQVLGENYSMVGYDSAEAMVDAFMDDEEAHVEAMVKYILATGIADNMRREDWATVARVYNGPGYKKNQYDVKMAREFAKLRKVADVEWESDEGEIEFMIPMGDELKTIQKRLSDLGYREVGKADGVWGTKARAAVLAFRADNGLPLVPGITDDMMSALMLAPKRQISEARASTTADDLRKAGSRTVGAADKTTGVGVLIGAGGALTAITEALSGVQGQIDDLSGLAGSVTAITDSLDGVSPYLLLALAGYMVYQQFMVKRARVDDERTGKTS